MKRCYDFFAFRKSAGEWPRFTSSGIFSLLEIVTRMEKTTGWKDRVGNVAGGDLVTEMVGIFNQTGVI